MGCIKLKGDITRAESLIKRLHNDIISLNVYSDHRYKFLTIIIIIHRIIILYNKSWTFGAECAASIFYSKRNSSIPNNVVFSRNLFPYYTLQIHFPYSYITYTHICANSQWKVIYISTLYILFAKEPSSINHSLYTWRYKRKKKSHQMHAHFFSRNNPVYIYIHIHKPTEAMRRWQSVTSRIKRAARGNFKAAIFSRANGKRGSKVTVSSPKVISLSLSLVYQYLYIYTQRMTVAAPFYFHLGVITFAFENRRQRSCRSWKESLMGHTSFLLFPARRLFMRAETDNTSHSYVNMCVSVCV